MAGMQVVSATREVATVNAKIASNQAAILQMDVLVNEAAEAVQGEMEGSSGWASAIQSLADLTAERNTLSGTVTRVLKIELAMVEKLLKMAVEAA